MDVRRRIHEAWGFEPASVYLCVALLLLFAGPGRFSLDRFVFGEKSSESAPV